MGNGEVGTAPSAGPPPYAGSQRVYRLLAGYGLVRQIVKGKSVADIRLEAGPEMLPLAEMSASAVFFLDRGAPATPAPPEPTDPKTQLEMVELPNLPSPSGSLDLVVALEILGTLEKPEGLVAEAKRVLKGDGVLAVSIQDRTVGSLQEGMFVPELEDMLRRHFAHVDLYRSGAVAGGVVYGPSGPSGLEVESASPTSVGPVFEGTLPDAGAVLAVCGDAELPQIGPYLLLDRDGSVFEESERGREEAELLREEVRQMQETEVRAFVETLTARENQLQSLQSQMVELRSRLRDSETRARQTESRLRLIENSRGWRTLQALRRLKPGGNDGE